MPIDQEQLFNEIKDKVNERLRGSNLTTPPDFLYRWILGEIQTNRALVPTNVSSNNYHMSRLQEIIASWINAEVDSSEVNVEQILYHLANEGWIVIPPQQ